MSKVTLISYTGAGNPDPLYAARLLAYTKNTRLNMTPEGMESFSQKNESEILLEMAYMASTIPSSWEFVDVIFSIEKVSRATAQQITRTRTASFAMQSQRVTDMSDVTWDAKEGKNDRFDLSKEEYDIFIQSALHCYKRAVSCGLPLEDAREILPIGVHCNLVAKYNLRGLVDLCRARDSLRVQGAYRDVCEQMKAEVFKVWPWASIFFEHPHEKAIKMVEGVAKSLQEQPGAIYAGASGTLAKAADLLKK